MSFSNHQCKSIQVDHEDESYIYLSIPSNIRVNKSSYAIEKYSASHKAYIPVHFTVAGMKTHYYPAFRADNSLWNAVRVIATLFVPNPDKFKFVYSPNHDLNPLNMRWVKTPAMFELNDSITSIEDRKILDNLESSSKEYHRTYNNIKGSDGLNHTQRFVKRMKDKGYVQLSKRKSPTGRAVWVPMSIKLMVDLAIQNGSINNENIRSGLVEMINTLPRLKKPYKEPDSTKLVLKFKSH